MAPFRKIVAKIIGGGMMILIILMWLCLPFYWGSRESSAHHFLRQ